MLKIIFMLLFLVNTTHGTVSNTLLDASCRTLNLTLKDGRKEVVGVDFTRKVYTTHKDISCFGVLKGKLLISACDCSEYIIAYSVANHFSQFHAQHKKRMDEFIASNFEKTDEGLKVKHLLECMKNFKVLVSDLGVTATNLAGVELEEKHKKLSFLSQQVLLGVWRNVWKSNLIWQGAFVCFNLLVFLYVNSRYAKCGYSMLQFPYGFWFFFPLVQGMIFNDSLVMHIMFAAIICFAWEGSKAAVMGMNYDPEYTHKVHELRNVLLANHLTVGQIFESAKLFPTC